MLDTTLFRWASMSMSLTENPCDDCHHQTEKGCAVNSCFIGTIPVCHRYIHELDWQHDYDLLMDAIDNEPEAQETW